MISRHIARLLAISGLMLFIGSAIARQNPQEKKYSSKELDELIVKVFQNCKTNLENLRGYVFSETETIDTQDSHLMIALQKQDPSTFKNINIHARIDYIWILIDNYLIPNPTRINGKIVFVTRGHTAFHSRKPARRKVPVYQERHRIKPEKRTWPVGAGDASSPYRRRI